MKRAPNLLKGVISNTEGIKCWNCGHWNLHEECGTYEVLVPMCIECNSATERGFFEEDNPF